MVQPELLVETGHSYEAAHIQRWLDSHDTCPISRKQLASKQLVVNYNLQKAVAAWAAEHGTNLPPAPVYQSLHEGVVSTAQQQQQQHGQQQQQVFHHGVVRSKDTSSVVVDQMPSVRPAPAGPSDSGNSSSNISFVGMDIKDRSKRKGCTRTRWALGLAALLLLAVAGVAAGVGVYFSNRNKGKVHGPGSTFAGPFPIGPIAKHYAPLQIQLWAAITEL
jgi:hypothetical protein